MLGANPNEQLPNKSYNYKKQQTNCNEFTRPSIHNSYKIM